MCLACLLLQQASPFKTCDKDFFIFGQDFFFLLLFLGEVRSRFFFYREGERSSSIHFRWTRGSQKVAMVKQIGKVLQDLGATPEVRFLRRIANAPR